MKESDFQATNPPDPVTERVVSFLQSIGLEAAYIKLNDATFLPGISIENGAILIDPSRLLHPGDLLHEAGHIAVVPAGERSTLNCDSIALRSQRGAEEMMAIAWSYAAAVHLGIDPRVVFHDMGYKGGGENILAAVRDSQTPIGAPMLQYHGLCRYGKHAAESGLPSYPHMMKWTLD